MRCSSPLGAGSMPNAWDETPHLSPKGLGSGMLPKPMGCCLGLTPKSTGELEMGPIIGPTTMVRPNHVFKVYYMFGPIKSILFYKRLINLWSIKLDLVFYWFGTNCFSCRFVALSSSCSCSVGMKPDKQYLLVMFIFIF
jgi:hypothetical protein